MRKLSLIRLTVISLILFGATAIHSQETGSTPTTLSALDSLTIARAANGDCETVAECRSMLEIANRRQMKALDAFDAATASANAKEAVIKAKDDLISLYKQAIEVKDLIIKFQDELIRKLQKPNSGFMGRLKSILKTVERVILVAAGVYVGRL